MRYIVSFVMASMIFLTLAMIKVPVLSFEKEYFSDEILRKIWSTSLDQISSQEERILNSEAVTLYLTLPGKKRAVHSQLKLDALHAHRGEISEWPCFDGTVIRLWIRQLGYENNNPYW